MMILKSSAVLAGFLLDQAIGDPPGWPHPVIFMGKVIDKFEKAFNSGSRFRKRLMGAVLTILLVGGSFALTAFLIWQMKKISLTLGIIIEVVLLSTTLATKSLLDAGNQVVKPLREGDLPEARNKLGWFVSRDTSDLSENDIARGTVETLAENFVDGILSPLFYMAIGGAPLAMAFKAVSTLDSMIGYKNDRYQDFGWFAARADDWANYIPARLSVGILLLAGWLQKRPVAQALKVWKRDARKHPSPNGGNPESIVAGLLGIQLGGINIYHGQIHHRAEMGDPLHEQTWQDIQGCQSLVKVANWIGVGFCLGVAIIVSLLVRQFV